jgi:predicted metal-dependent phosphotriesterase family hydrolase
MVFFGKRTVTSSITTTAALKDVVALVKQPTTLVGLNPLCVSICQRDKPGDDVEKRVEGEGCYLVTDRIPIIGSWSFNRTFSVDFEQLEDGVNTKVNAGMSVRLVNKWRVREDAQKGTVIEETIELEVSFSLSYGFVGILIALTH